MENLTDLIVLAQFTEACHTYGTASFESIYREPACASWILAAAFAIGAGAFIILSGGLGSGPVAAIGTWVGGLMGYSGAAATNAGLALLGGGSIAAGGFGMAGGAAILTAALTFSTEFAFDYTFNRAMSGYDYRSLAKSSKGLPTLPLPINEDGPNAYQSGMAVLEEIDRSPVREFIEIIGCRTSISACPEPILPYEIEGNRQKKIQQAIEAIKESLPKEHDDQAKAHTLLSLLHFVSNDYQSAKHYAGLAIFEHVEAGLDEADRTLPAFIFATAGLYDKHVSHSAYLNGLKQSILLEPDNPLIPLMFSIYLDRLIHISDRRSWDDRVLQDSLREVFRLMTQLNQQDSGKDVRMANYAALLARYFLRLKLEQQKIMALVLDPDIAARADPAVLTELGRALTTYITLLNDAKPVLETARKTAVEPVVGAWMKMKKSMEFLPLTGNSEEMDHGQQMHTFSQLFDDYYADLPRLTCLGVYGESRSLSDLAMDLQ